MNQITGILCSRLGAELEYHQVMHVVLKDSIWVEMARFGRLSVFRYNQMEKPSMHCVIPASLESSVLEVQEGHVRDSRLCFLLVRLIGHSVLTRARMWGFEVIFWSQKESASKKSWKTLSQSMPFTSSVNNIRTVWWRSNRRDQMIKVLVLLQRTKVWNVTWTYLYTFASLCVHVCTYVCVSLVIVIFSSFIIILDHGKMVTYNKY
jgi:hypothetical protein